MFLKPIILFISCLLSVFVKGQAADTTVGVSKEIVFASDTQAPMWVETLVLKSNHNRLATKHIFDNILTRNPAAVYLLGDVVALGSSTRQWKPMDTYLQRLRNKGIKVNAALGNHELMGQGVKGQKKFQRRFPKHVKTGSLDVTDSVAVILLNSNFGSLSSSEDTAQTNWYRHTLNQLDADSSIRFIITGCHHSPYTNSRIVGSSIGVIQRFVPYFIKSKKSRLFLSGHSHNFEHFQQQGKDFFVIGGGGGLHQPLKKGEGLPPDLSASYKPLFHYLSVKREANKLQLMSIKLTSDFSGFEQGAEFEISQSANAAVKDVGTLVKTSVAL